MKRAFSVFFAIPTLLACGLSAAGATGSPLVGTWQLDGTQSDEAGLYIFTPTHYSMVAAFRNRADVVDAGRATAPVLRALWGPLLANSGTYDVAGDLITIHPVVAKSPVVMKAGSTEVYRFHIDGKTLTLTQVKNARGVDVKTAPVMKFVRVE